MTGPRAAGRAWTLTDDAKLRKLLVSGNEGHPDRAQNGACRRSHLCAEKLSEAEDEVIDHIPAPRVAAVQRQLMQYLRSGDWTLVTKIPVVASAKTLTADMALRRAN